MKLEGISYKEIQDIKKGIEALKREQWNILTKRVKKDTPFDKIQEYKKAFDNERNQFIDVGRYNHILDVIQTLDDDLQKELSQ